MPSDTLAQSQSWEKIGQIIAPDSKYPWMSTFAGPSYALQVGRSSLFDLYVTGRNHKNCSSIGRVRINLEEPSQRLEISNEPVFSPGDPGAFDENGVSYPYFVRKDSELYFFYVGWMPTVITPFQNHLGLAKQDPDGKFRRVSRAPILERTDQDYLSIGSCCVIPDQGKFRMWYTCFLKWGSQPDEQKHYYVIKYAESDDLIHWKRDNLICIDIQNKNESSISRPTVVKIGNLYHMWFCYRGEQYRIGYAHSEDGLHWKRQDERAGISVSSEGWDSQALCYPHVFKYQDYLYMIYNGNQYGKEGLGLARMKL